MATCLTPPLKVTISLTACEYPRVRVEKNTATVRQNVDIYANKSSETNKCSGGKVEKSWKTL